MDINGDLRSSAIGLMNFTLTESVSFAISGSLVGTAKDPLDEFRPLFRMRHITRGPSSDIINESDVANATSANLVLGDGIFDSGNNGPT